MTACVWVSRRRILHSLLTLLKHELHCTTMKRNKINENNSPFQQLVFTTRQELGRNQSQASTSSITSSPLSGQSLTSSFNATPAHEVTTVAIIKPKKKRIRLKTERRREQCRINQARYRNRQRDEVVDLQSSVNMLKEQIDQLRLQRQTLSTRVISFDFASPIVCEYFRLFQSGMCVKPMNDAERGQEQRQFEFLTSALDRNLHVIDETGRSIFMEQIRRFSLYYGDMDLKVQTMECMQSSSETTRMRARYLFYLTITITTIEQVFPHLEYHPAIKWRLLGKRLYFPASVTFDVNHCYRITGVEWSLDFVAGLSTILSLPEVALVLQQASIKNNALLTQEVSEMECEVLVSEVEYEVNHHLNGDSEVQYSLSSNDRESTTYEILHLPDGEYLHDGKGDDYMMV